MSDLFCKIKGKDKYVFYLGIIMIPFDNLFFAPSYGWATVAPILLSIYSILNLGYYISFIKKNRELMYVVYFSLTMSLINYLFVQFDFRLLFGAGISIGLGVLGLPSLFIYRDKEGTGNFSKLMICIFYGYSLSLLCGIVQYIAINMEVDWIIRFFDLLFLRSEYLHYGRVMYLFTEPSFIGMHIFGIILPLFLLTKDRKFLYLVIAFVISMLFFAPGVKSLLDIVSVGTIIIFGKIIRIKNLKKKIIILISCFILLGSSITVLYKTNERVHNIFSEGINGDASLAVRYLRINASVKGYLEEPIGFIFGYGIGNARYPLDLGYAEARKEYTNPWTVEADDQYKLIDDGGIMILYIRFISEFGILVFLYFSYKLMGIYFKSEFYYKLELFLINIYLYVQFEAYGFYALGLLVYALVYGKSRKKLSNEKKLK